MAPGERPDRRDEAPASADGARPRPHGGLGGRLLRTGGCGRGRLLLGGVDALRVRIDPPVQRREWTRGQAPPEPPLLEAQLAPRAHPAAGPGPIPGILGPGPYGGTRRARGLPAGGDGPVASRPPRPDRDSRGRAEAPEVVRTAGEGLRGGPPPPRGPGGNPPAEGFPGPAGGRPRPPAVQRRRRAAAAGGGAPTLF